MFNIYKYYDLMDKISKRKRLEFAFLPTPLHKLENLSKYLNANIFLKRDDLTGFSTFGGNKMRKLEFLFADLIEKDSEYVFTYGATQSNHALQTAITANYCGVKPVLYLVDVIKEKNKLPKANLLLDKILNAEIKLIDLKEGEESFEAMNRAQEESKKYIERLSEQKNDCYIIPPGGATPVGSLGFINAYLEIKKYEKDMHISFDHIFHATGTGGTLAGLTAANSYLEDDIQIHGINVSNKDDRYINDIIKLAEESLSIIDIEKKITKENIDVSPDYVGDGYEVPTDEANDAIKLFAEKEGIFLDPVYTGKAAAALVDYIGKGKVEDDSNIIFWHTGGTNALFADEKMLGNLI